MNMFVKQMLNDLKQTHYDATLEQVTEPNTWLSGRSRAKQTLAVVLFKSIELMNVAPCKMEHKSEHKRECLQTPYFTVLKSYCLTSSIFAVGNHTFSSPSFFFAIFQIIFDIF